MMDRMSDAVEPLLSLGIGGHRIRLSDMDARELIRFLDLTTLGPTDTAAGVRVLAERAMTPVANDSSLHCAALCVWSNFAPVAAEVLAGSGVELACVAGAFPHAQAPLEVKVREVELAVAAGATEIDVAISRGRLLEGEDEWVSDELRALRDACGQARFKVILETCELVERKVIRRACEAALAGGADFLKTSTGMGGHGATLEHAAVLFEAARDWHDATGTLIGVKVAGGIRTFDEALGYYEMAVRYLPDVTPETFRIGASGLLNDLVQRL